LFQASRGNKPADSETCPVEQQPMSDQASSGTEHDVSNKDEESCEGNSNSNATNLDEVATTEGQNGLNFNPISTCCTTQTSSIFHVTVDSVSNEQTNTATITSGSAQTSKGVIIRPITTASESASKAYVFHSLMQYIKLKHDVKML